MRSISISVLLLSSVAVTGCGGDDATAADAPPVQQGAAKYAVLGVVYDAESSTSYISLLDSLDVQEVDYSRALEIPGSATMNSYAGWLFVADSADLTITRYSTESGTFVKDSVLSLANREIEDLQIDDFANTFVDAHKAYLIPGAASTVIWDPTDMVSRGEIATPEFGRPAPLGLDFGPGVLRDGRVYRAVTWRDFDEDITSDEQYLSVIDTATDQLVDMIPEARCPGITNRVSADESGNLYFSSWFNAVAQSLVLGAPRPCALRLAPRADRFDPDWRLVFSDVAEGRNGAALNYLARGDAFMSIFHDERVTIDSTTTVADLDDSANWRFWRVDLPSATAAPLAGLDWLGSRTFTFSFDGRTYLLVPGPEFDTTALYEITEAGAEPRFDIQGFSYQLLKLR